MAGGAGSASEDEGKDNPLYKGMMSLKGELFTWSDDELLRQRAADIARQCQYLGLSVIYLHFPDTVNENWVNRSDKDRQRFGDDRAKADANVIAIFHDTLKKAIPDAVVSPINQPYTAYYLKDEYYATFIRDLAAAMPKDVWPCLREYDTAPFRKMCDLYQRPYNLYYEPNRMVREGDKRIGLDRSMVTTSPRFFKSFSNGRSDNIILNIWAYSRIDFEVNNQYAWNLNSPGAEETFTWMDRLTPFDGEGNDDFFNKTMLTICAEVFGAQAAPAMTNLFKLKLKTAFLLQPFAIASYSLKMYMSDYAAKLPKIDFDNIIKEQAARVVEADRIVTALSTHPEYFPLASQQQEFARYYKEVKLLRWLAPINVCKWEARRLIEEDHAAEAKAKIAAGYAAVEAARNDLQKEIAALQGKFKDDHQGSVLSVPCGPNSSNSWDAKYLDTYFKNELAEMEKNSGAGKKSKGTPLSPEDLRSAKENKMTAVKTSNGIKLDGKFDEDAWRKAGKKVFVKILGASDTGKELYYPDARGEAMAAWDDKNLYLALTFGEDDIDSMVGSTGDRDKSIFRDDIFELFLQPVKDGSYGHLLANVSGRKWDAVPKSTNFGFENDLRWNPGWEVAIFIDAANRKWQAEVKIPFDAFSEAFFGQGAAPKTGSHWRVNIGRERRTLECSSIAPCDSFHDKDKYCDLTFEEAK